VLVALVGGSGAGAVGTATALVGIGSWIAVPAGSYFDGRRRGNDPPLELLAFGVVPYAGALAGFVYVVRRERDREVDGAGSASGRGTAAVLGATTGTVGRLHGSLGSLETLPHRLFDRTKRNGFGRVKGSGTHTGEDVRPRRGRADHPGSTGERRNGHGRPEMADTTTETRSEAAGDPDRASNEAGASGGDEEGTAGVGDGSGGHTLGPPVRRSPRESRTIRYDGVDFRCQSVGSGDGRWRVAWGTGSDETDTPSERVFVLQYEARQFAVDATGVSECAVGPDGTVAVVERDGDEVSRIRILSATGETVVDRGFEGSLRSVAVTSGEARTLVGSGLGSPPRLVVVDGQTGETVLEQEITTDPDVVEFRDSDGDRWLVVGSESQPTPDVAVRVHDGEVARL
jgi:hypothetical protein